VVALAPACSGLLPPFPGSASSVPAAPAPVLSCLLLLEPASAWVGDGGGAGVGANGGAGVGASGGASAGGAGGGVGVVDRAGRRDRGGENGENRVGRGDEIAFFFSSASVPPRPADLPGWVCSAS
jgi:hypothetical protein